MATNSRETQQRRAPRFRKTSLNMVLRTCILKALMLWKAAAGRLASESRLLRAIRVYGTASVVRSRNAPQNVSSIE